ncbi:PE domain-containing protein [Mycobacterium camsae]|uniref:PE domain-containing protein n=1 Tax=Mycobacterium gordonae TaxID=1778 RepID=UPI0019800502
MSAQAAVFHRDFLAALAGGANSYATAESANAQLTMWSAVNAARPARMRQQARQPRLRQDLRAARAVTVGLAETPAPAG